MTREERNNKLKYFITCMKCEMSGKCRDDENCPIQYEAGNMGEIIENLEEISKILELEPCEDCISRETLLDKKWDVPYEGKYIQVVDVGDIKELPSVTPKKEEWIPCDEKPNELVDNVHKYYLIQDEYGDMCVARYTKKGWHPIESLFFLDDVVAWMPLPEPYKAESEEK